MIKLILIISFLIPNFFAFTIKTAYNAQSANNNDDSRSYYSSSYSSPINTANVIQKGSTSSHYSKSFRTDNHGNVLLSNGNIESDGNLDGSNHYGTRYETNKINKGSDGGYNSFIDEISKNVEQTEQEQKLIKNLNNKDINSYSNVFHVNEIPNGYEKDGQSQIYESHSKTSSVSFSKNMDTKEKDDLIKSLREKYDNVKPIYDDNGDIIGYSGSRTIVKQEGNELTSNNNGLVESRSTFSEFLKSFERNMTEQQKEDFLKKLREKFGENAKLIYNDKGELIGYSSGVETIITHNKVYEAKPISSYPSLNLDDLAQIPLTKTYGSQFETSSISFSENMGTKEKEDLLKGLRDKFENIKPMYNDKGTVIGYSGSRTSASYGGGGPTSELDSSTNVIYSAGSHLQHSEFDTFDVNMGVGERENFLKKLREKYGEHAKLIYNDKGQLVGYSSGNEINSNSNVGGKIHSYVPFLDTSRHSSVSKTFESEFETSSISFSEDMETTEKDDLLKGLREKFDNIKPIYNDKGGIIGYSGSRTRVIHGGSGPNLEIDSSLNAHPNHSKLDMSITFDKNMGVREQENFLKRLQEKYGANARLNYNDKGVLVGYSYGDQINTRYHVDGKIYSGNPNFNADNLEHSSVTKTYGSEYETSSISFSDEMETKEKADLLKNLRDKFDNVKPIYNDKNKIIGYSGSRTSVAYANTKENPRLDSTLNTVYFGGSQSNQLGSDITFDKNMGVREQENFLKRLQEKYGTNARLNYNDKGELVGYSSGDQINTDYHVGGKVYSGNPIFNADNLGHNSVTKTYGSEYETSSISFSDEMGTKEKADLLKNLRDKFDNVKPIYNDKNKIIGYSGSRTSVAYANTGENPRLDSSLNTVYFGGSQSNQLGFEITFDKNMGVREQEIFLKKLQEKYGTNARLNYNDKGELVGYSSGDQINTGYHVGGKVYSGNPIFNADNLGHSSVTKTYGSEYETSSISFSDDMGTKEKADLLKNLRDKFDNVKPIYNDKNKIIGYSGSRTSVDYANTGENPRLDSSLNTVYFGGSQSNQLGFEITFDKNMGVREQEIFLKKLKEKYGSNARLNYNDKGELVGYSSGDQINTGYHVGGKVYSGNPIFNADNLGHSSVTKTYGSEYETSSISFSDDMGTKEKADLLKNLRDKFDNVKPIYNDKNKIIGYSGSRTSVAYANTGENPRLDSTLNTVYFGGSQSNQLGFEITFDKNMGVREQENFLKKLQEKYGANARLNYNDKGELVGYSYGDQINTGYHVDGKFHSGTPILNLDSLGHNSGTKTYGSEYETSSISFSDDMGTKEKADLLKNLRDKFDNVKPIYNDKNKIIGYSGSRRSVAYANTGENPRLDSTLNTVYFGGSQSNQLGFDITFDKNMGVKEQEIFLTKLREKYGTNARLIYNDKGELIGYSSEAQTPYNYLHKPNFTSTTLYENSGNTYSDNVNRNVDKTYYNVKPIYKNEKVVGLFEVQTSTNNIFNDLLNDFQKSNFKTIVTFNQNLLQKELDDMIKFLQETISNGKLIYNHEGKIIGFSSVLQKLTENNDNLGTHVISAKEQEDMINTLQDKYGSNTHRVSSHSTLNTQPPRLVNSYSWKMNSNSNLDPYGNTYQTLNNQNFEHINTGAGTNLDDLYTEHFNFVKLHKFTKCPPNITGQFAVPENRQKFLNCWKGEGAIQECGVETVFDETIRGCAKPSEISSGSSFTYNEIVHNNRDKINSHSYGLGARTTKPHNSNSNDLSDSGSSSHFSVIDADKNSENQYAQHYQYVKLHHFSECPSGLTGQFAMPDNNRKFLNCWNGVAAVQECGADTVFDERIRGCTRVTESNINLGNSGTTSSNVIITQGQGTRPIYSSPSSKPAGGAYYNSGSSAHSYSTGISTSTNPSHNYGGSAYTNGFNSGTNSGIKTITTSNNRNQNSYDSRNNDYTHSQQSNKQPTLYGSSHGSYVNRLGSGYGPGSSSQGSIDIRNENAQPINGNNGLYVSNVNDPLRVQGVKTTGTHGSYVSGTGSTYGHGTTHSSTSYDSSTNDQASTGLNNLDQYHQHYNYVKQHKFSKCPVGVTGQFAIPENCHKFLNCWNGEGAVQECGAGTVFNEKIRGCDFPSGNEHSC